MTDIIAAEWAKLSTGRPMRYTLAALGLFTVLMLAVAASFVGTWDALPPEGRAASSMGSLTELLGWIASLVMAVFGALAITGEWSSGMLRLTFVAMPGRECVLAAKALVVAGTAFGACLVALLVTFVGVAAIVGTRDITGQGPADLDGLRMVVAQALSATMFGLLGLALGTIMRSALASVVTLVAAWYVVPLLAGRLPAPWDEWLLGIVPGALASQVAGFGGPSVFASIMEPPAALAVMLAYGLGPLVAATAILRRRDP